MSSFLKGCAQAKNTAYFEMEGVHITCVQLCKIII